MSRVWISSIVRVSGHVIVYLTQIFAAQYDSTLIKLQNADVQIEDLKLQLDDALGAEEMLVQLTERNLMLGEVSFTSTSFQGSEDNRAWTEN
jgi:hypothetical protein